MNNLLLCRLPPEIRLQIYRILIIEPEPVPIWQSRAADSTAPWTHALTLMEVDKSLATSISDLYWSINTFSIVLRGFQYDYVADEMLRVWLEEVVCEAVSSIRHLVFVIYLPCVQQGQDRRSRPTKTCTAIVTVHLDTPDHDLAIQVHDSKGCSHRANLVPRFQDSLNRIARQCRKPLVNKDVLWDLYECCYPFRVYDRRRSYGEFML